MKKKILILPFAIADDSMLESEDYLSRQIPVLLRNCFEDARPGAVVASPLATEVEGQRLWVVHRRLWVSDDACRFASERGFEYVAVGRLSGPGGDGADRNLEFRLLAVATPSEPVVEMTATADVFTLARKLLQPLAAVVDIPGDHVAGLLDPGTESASAYESYLSGLDVLLCLRSHGMNLDEPAKMLEPFERALTLDPEFGHALTAGLSCALQVTEPAGEGVPFEPIVATLERWLKVAPGDPRVFAVKAEILIHRERKIEALAVIRDGLEKVRPVNHDLLRRSGDLLVELGKTREALDAYRACEDVQHETTVLERMVSLSIMIGDLEAAGLYLDQLTDEEPDRPDLWSRRALLAHRAGDEEKTWSCFARVFNSVTSPAEADLVKVNTVLSQCPPDDVFLAAIKSWYPSETLGDVRRVLFARTLRLAGANLEAGLCLKSVKGEKLSSELRSTLARERLNLAIEGFDSKFAALAHTIVNEGLPEDTGLLDRVTGDEPEFWPARFLNGLVLSKRGSFTESLGELDYVLGLQPDNDVVWYTRGLQLVRLGNDEEASESFRSAISINGNETDYHANLALAQARLDHPDEARRCLTEVFRLRPEHPDNERIREAVEEIRPEGG